MRIPPIFRVAILPLVLLALTACESPGEPQEQEDGEPDISWLQQTAAPLHSTSPGDGFDDLAALGAMVGDARIVGLGEGTHGTREFFRMKHRTLEYLVREKGFSTFGIEATFAEATRLNRYVLTGAGDPEVLLSNLYFWTWNTAEVLEMIQWMRAWNQDPAHTRKVTFWGFDMQFSRVSMDDVVAYLRGVDAVAADSADSWYGCYRGFQDSIARPSRDYGGAAAAGVRPFCHAGVVAVDSLMEARASAFTAASGRPAYDLARRIARIVVQNEDMRAHPSQTGALRDRYMAENVEWLAETGAPGTRLVLWAHNMHVSRAPGLMGAHLGVRFGAAYRPVGFSFWAGGLNAVQPGVGLRATDTPAAVAESYEHQFHRLGLAAFALDVRPVRTGGAPRGARWLAGPRLMRQIGAVYSPDYDSAAYRQTPLAEEYDILIHVESVTPTILLPFRYQ